MKLKIKKGANVEVITGSDKGKKGVVLQIDPQKLLIKVQGVRMQTHFDKQKGLNLKEGFISYSNVKLVEQPAPRANQKKTEGKNKKKLNEVQDR